MLCAYLGWVFTMKVSTRDCTISLCHYHLLIMQHNKIMLCYVPYSLKFLRIN